MLLKKSLAIFLAISTFSSVSFANEVEVSDLLTDNFHGAGNSDEHSGGSGYDILALEAERITNSSNQTFLNVYIDTNFTAKHSKKRGDIDYGDLFITTEDLYTPDTNSKDTTTFDRDPGKLDEYRRNDLGSDTRWQYAFDIDDASDRSGEIGSTGELVKLYNSSPISNDDWAERAYANSLQTAEEYNDARDGRENQAVAVHNSTGLQSTYSGGNYITSANNTSTNYWSNDIGKGKNGANNRITFSFEITGIDALVNAEQLAFRWAMTCANDIVEGLVKFKSDTTSVPEPTTWALMLLALAGLIYKRKRADINFSA